MRFREWYSDQSPLEQKTIRHRVARTHWTFEEKVHRCAIWTLLRDTHQGSYSDIARVAVTKLMEEIVYELRERNSQLP